MASPRGRSLVFGLAGREPEEGHPRCKAEGEPWTEVERAYVDLMEASHLAQYLIDRQRENLLVVYGLDEDQMSQSVLPAEVAQKLRRIQRSEPTQTALRHAMCELIAGAMYWQPPHPDVILAEDPDMQNALLPFAHALVDSGLTDSWARTLDRDNQWSLAWDDSEHRGILPAVFSADPATPMDLARVTRKDLTTVIDDDMPGATSAQRLEAWTAEVLASEARYRLDFVRNPYQEVSGQWPSTPHHGLWSSTSTWGDEEPVGLDLVEDDCGLERARACHLVIGPNARICEINRPDDWAELCRRYPLDVSAQRRNVWFETTGRKGRWVIPDWSRVAEEFDGVHVSLAGYLRTAGVVVVVGDHSLVEASASLPAAGNTDDLTASLMAGWNPDATYWLNDVITGIAEVVDWSFDDERDEWMRR